MDSLTQLKKVREDAIARLRECDDYKLIGKLGDLITELGGTLSPLPAGVAVDNMSAGLMAGSDAKLDTDAKSPTPASSFQTSLGASTATDTSGKSSVVDTEKDDVEAAEDLVDEMVAELKSENLVDDDTPVSSSDDDDEKIPAVSIFRTRLSQSANGAAKSI